MKKSSPTTRQLAVWAGVSQSAVSLALRNHPSIPKKTRERIHALAREKGYRIDPVVSTLKAQLRMRRGRSTAERIAFLTSWDSRDAWRHKNPGRIFEGIVKRASELGYDAEAMWAKEPGLSGRRLSEILRTRAIRGIIFSALSLPFGHVTLDWRYFSPVATSYTIAKPEMHRVGHAHYQGMALALRHLRRLGYRRIGFATLLDQDRRANRSWMGAYLAFEQEMPAAHRVPPLLLQERDPRLLAKWLAQYRPEAFVSNMRPFLQMARDAGFRVPEDVGYASLDLQRGDHSSAGIYQQMEKVGAAAVDLIASQLQNNQLGLPDYVKNVQIDGVWCPGATVRASGD